MGVYEINTFLYDNKNIVLGVTITAVFLLMGLMFFVWWNDSHREEIMPPPVRHRQRHRPPGPYSSLGFGEYGSPRF